MDITTQILIISLLIIGLIAGAVQFLFFIGSYIFSRKTLMRIKNEEKELG